MSKKSILIIDDENHISDLMEINFQSEGYKTFTAENGADGIAVFKSNHIDIVILDRMLPDSTGIEVCKVLKQIKSVTPILMVSALGQSTDRIAGLKSGADDYLPKPFNLEELLIRIEKLIDRFNVEGMQSMQEIKIGNRTFDSEKQTVADGEDVHTLSQRECELLRYLIDHADTVIGRDELLREVWRHDVPPNTRTVDNFIAALRKYIEPNPNRPTFLKTIRGRGYFFTNELQ